MVSCRKNVRTGQDAQRGGKWNSRIAALWLLWVRVTLNIVFMGTPDLAQVVLRELLQAAEWRVQAVVTQPDKPRGRQLKLEPSPVKQLAVQNSIPLLQPQRAKDTSFLEQLRQLKPDLAVVAAFGQILPQAVLDVPRFGCLNVHTSLLPRYRGAAPIQWALIQGETETGVTIMQMDAGMDTGPIIASERLPISDEDDSQSLHDKLAVLGSRLLAQTVPRYISGELQPTPQRATEASYAPKITKEDGRIDWSLPGEVLKNRLRGFTPWPGLFTYLMTSSGGRGEQEASRAKLLKIWQLDVIQAAGQGAPGVILTASKEGIVVACGQQAARITSLQAEGGRRMTAGEFLAGRPLLAGARLGIPAVDGA